MSDKVLSCINLKGGVGKTALAVNFAAYDRGDRHRSARSASANTFDWWSF